MLQYNVRNILADPRIVIPVEENLELTSISEGSEVVPIVQPPKITGKIVNLDGNTLKFTGSAELVMRMPCSRCMEDVDVPVKLEFSQTFVPEESGDSDRDEDAETFAEYRLDLTDFVMGEIRLGIPMKVLCREDCKGLCPKCGRNLNEGPCGCDLHEEDPRWDALKGLLQGKNKV